MTMEYCLPVQNASHYPYHPGSLLVIICTPGMDTIRYKCNTHKHNTRTLWPGPVPALR